MNDPNLTITQTRPEHAEAIAAIERASNPSHWTAAMLRHSLGQPGCVAVVGLRQDLVVAHALSATVLDEAELLLIAVDPCERRLGVGRRILAALQEAWRAEGITRASLEVRASNLPASALYASMGWQPVGLRRGYYADGEDAHILGLRLSGSSEDRSNG